ncbi:MAG TPA: hypothetical protein VLN59_04450, partial [Burkholderiales bacterium]|nr:hypothetical protein [Burkholderiales bacterium]
MASATTRFLDSFRVVLFPLLSIATVFALAGCGTQITPNSVEERAINLRKGNLEAYGLAFITPSTVTGQEEEKQAIAFIFHGVMKERRPGVQVVALSEALGAINRHGLAEAYKQMYNDYRDTGLFKRDILKQVADATGVRYIAQIKLQEFQQGAKERFGALGFRLVETRFANVRLFLQIWDSSDGSIAWEGMQELFYASDRVREEPITLHTAVEQTAGNLIARLP